MKRHHWPETLKKQKREASHQRTAECVPRLKKLVREIQGAYAETGAAEIAYRKDSPRGNFSLYPILFIASQDMFVKPGAGIFSNTAAPKLCSIPRRTSFYAAEVFRHTIHT